MDYFVIICACLQIILTIIVVFNEPFLNREPLMPYHYVATILGAFMTGIIVGRVLGLW